MLCCLLAGCPRDPAGDAGADIRDAGANIDDAGADIRDAGADIRDAGADIDDAGAGGCIGSAISGGVGAMIDGQTFIVTGCGFGEPGGSPPALFDTIDRYWIGGVEGTYGDLSDGDTMPCGPGYPFERNNTPNCNSSGLFKYDTASEQYGNRSAHMRAILGYQRATMEWPAGFPEPSTQTTTRYFARWYFKADFDPSSQSGSHKFHRVWDSRGGTANGIRISWTQKHLTYPNSPTGTNDASSWNDWGGVTAAWNLMELYVDVDAGRIRAWTNGTLIHDINDFVPRTGFLGLQPRSVGLDGSGSANFAGRVVELADFYANSTQARVEIGDAPNWDDVSVREVQPAIAWSDAQIEIRLNEGALGGLGGKYLYVILDNGTVLPNPLAL